MKKLIKLIVLSLTIIMVIISYTGCSEKSGVISKESYYMDTICRISIYDMEKMNEENAESAIADAFSLCADYESLISISDEDSDIYRINHAAGAPVECDPRTVEVIEMGRQAGEFSGGKFDITIGRVTDLWDFHSEEPKVPADEDIKTALTTVDYTQVNVDNNTVTLSNPESEINLGGVGKGYIADKAAELLKEEGVTSAIVDFGGNIITIGNKDGNPFKVGVEMPYSDRNEIVGSIEAENSTMVTSGIYERFFEADGVQYHHIIDVSTGYPADTDVVSVTIVGPLGSSGRCDGLSTICLLSGSEEGMAYIESLDGFEALFQTKDGKLLKTSGLDNFKEEK